MSWTSASLEELCEINVGRTPARANPEFWGAGKPWLSIADMNQGRVITSTKEQITEEATGSCRVVNPGTVLLSFKLSIGKVAMAGMPLYTNEAIAALPIKRTDRLLPEFLVRALEVQDLAGGSNRAAMGATLNKAKLKQIQIPLPPLDEQRRIAAILDQADALRARRRQVLAHLDDLTRSIFLEMFGDPVRNERGWPLRAFGEVCETRLGKMLDAKQQTGAHSRPYLRNANVQWFRFNLDDVLEMDFDEKSRATHRLEVGDVLICEGGRPGRAAVWRGELHECYYQKALHRARPNTDLAHPEFLVHLLWFVVHRGGLKDHVTSATISHLTGAKLKAMPIILPSIEIQTEFVRRLERVVERRTCAEHALGALTDLTESLQTLAFRGEL